MNNKQASRGGDIRLSSYIVYWLISEDYSQTYTGFSDNITRRIKEHQRGIVKSTRNFGTFRCFKLEEVYTRKDARGREKYWKSHAGRKRLRLKFNAIIHGPIV